ncbi:MAG TPA: hypothetical protein VKF84_01555 [Candidatus Sulfotelmatobacter sp.]|nr:hypothetical protein [Candidatus Sulfotelmatobacter sp.]
MRLLTFVKRAVLAIAVIAILLLAGVSIYLRVEQHRFRRQAERLLSDVRDLELKRADAAEVRLTVRKWGFEERGERPGVPCTADDCIYQLRLMPPARANNLADPFMSGESARVLELFGLRPTLVGAWLRIRGGALRSVSFNVWTLGRGCGEIGCTLVAEAGTSGESGWSSRQRPEAKLRNSLLHPDYLVGTFPAVLNADTGGSPSVIIWAELSPDASAADMSRLMQFDLSCLTRLRSCKDRDLMPTVWAQTVADTHESPKSLTCTPELLRHVTQLADVIAIVRPKTIDLSSPRYEGLPSLLPHAEIVGVIKKSRYSRLSNGLAVNVGVYSPNVTNTADTGAPIRASQQYLFLLQDNYGGNALYPCGILTFNAANLAMVHNTAGDGAD